MARRADSDGAGKATAGTRRSRPAGQDKQKRFAHINTATSQIVKEAAALLDDEVAAGVVAAKQMQERFRKEQRIDPADFQDALQRFQGDGHEVVNLLNHQFAALRSDENAEFVSRFITNTHDLLDVVVGAVNMGAEIANQLVAANLQKQTAPKPSAKSRG